MGLSHSRNSNLLVLLRVTIQAGQEDSRCVSGSSRSVTPCGLLIGLQSGRFMCIIANHCDVPFYLLHCSPLIHRRERDLHCIYCRGEYNNTGDLYTNTLASIPYMAYCVFIHMCRVVDTHFYYCHTDLCNNACDRHSSKYT